MHYASVCLNILLVFNKYIYMQPKKFDILEFLTKFYVRENVEQIMLYPCESCLEWQPAYSRNRCIAHGD